MKNKSLFCFLMSSIMLTACEQVPISGYSCLTPCDDDQVCFLAECIYPEADTCSEVCDTGYACIRGNCELIDEPDDSNPDTGDSCKCNDDEECIDHECIKLDTNECKPECDSNEECINGACFPIEEPEKCLPECNENESCAGGICVPNESNECKPACGANESCVEGICVPNESNECKPACGANESCVEGICVPNQTNTCNPACNADEVCENNICVSACKPACGANEVCQNKKCVSKCSSACASDETCDNSGKCQPVLPCTKKSDCQNGQYCHRDRCKPIPTVDCTDNTKCLNDTYCSGGKCTSFDSTTKNISSCYSTTAPGLYDLDVQCTWQAPSGYTIVSSPIVIKTPYKGKNHILIVSFRVTGQTADPSSSWAAGHGCVKRRGAIHILDGETCKEVAKIDLPSGSQKLSSGTVVAAADFNGDGNVELITRSEQSPDNSGTTKNYIRIYKWNGSEYKSSDPIETKHMYDFGSLSIHKAKDGTPLGIFGSDVFNLSTAKRVATKDSASAIAPVAPAVDIDKDGDLELIGNKTIFRYSTKYETAYENYTSFTAYSSYSGFSYSHLDYMHFAFADFGTVTDGKLDPKTLDGIPEVVLCSSKGLNIVSPVKGSKKSKVVFSETTATKLGPCAVADFDGDGLPEVAAVGAKGTYLFDPQCAAGTDGCKAAGIKWLKSNSNSHSQYMSVSGFDFNADGAVEMLESLNGYFHILNGKTGAVLASAWRPIEMKRYEWFENPVVADTDNDGSAEIVLTKTQITNDGNPASVDAADKGVSCTSDSDCISGSCKEKRCRCTKDAQCNGSVAAYKCTTMPTDDGNGKVCRAQPVSGEGNDGIRVLKHRKDAWPAARNIWNQYNYYISNINDDATLPLPAETSAKFKDPNYNAFRVNLRTGNVNGSKTNLADITAKLDYDTLLSGGAIHGTLCNRGLQTIPSGVSAAFSYTVGSNSTAICSAKTANDIASGACLDISCPTSVTIPNGAVVSLIPDTVSASCNKLNHQGQLTW